MGSIKIEAGDFPNGSATVSFGSIGLPWQPGDGFAGGKTLPLKDLEAIDIATEESVKKIGGTIGWGAVGGALLGPAGLLAGLLLGGKKTEVTFVARFKGDKKMLATTDSKTYKTLMAAAFK